MATAKGSMRYRGAPALMLRDLACHPHGLSTPELAARYFADMKPHQRALTRCGNRLRRFEAFGRVRRSGTVPGSWQQGPSVIWQVTEAGAFTALRMALADLRATSDLAQIEALGAEMQQVIGTLRFIVEKKLAVPEPTP